MVGGGAGRGGDRGLGALRRVCDGGFLTNMDDDVYLAACKQYGGLTMAGVRWAFTEFRPYYQPLPRLTYLLAYSMWGARPAPHHAVNLALHGCNAALVTVLAWTLLRFGMSSVRQSSSRAGDGNCREKFLAASGSGGFRRAGVRRASAASGKRGVDRGSHAIALRGAHAWLRAGLCAVCVGQSS